MQLEKEITASPLNYIGGKYKLLSQIIPLFPDNVNVFADIFCGGCNVGTNVKAQKIICNDLDSNLIGLFEFFKTKSYSEIKNEIDSVIEKYGLSNSFKNGYSFYNCNTADGLGFYNKEKFLTLRNDFNSLKKSDSKYFIYLYVLIIFAFNNQIRFNAKGNYNLPVGKRDFNKRMQKKLCAFLEKIKNIEFTNKSFEELNLKLSENDFVYADPPYLITCASYNEKNGWNENLEKELLDFLDSLNEKNVKFALSNVLTSKGKTNEILKNWLESNPAYKCHHLNYTYKNSNYHKKDKVNQADEVLITNY